MNISAEPISPFRYPGGKSDLLPYVASFVYENILQGADLYELYAGGASVSLSLLRSGIIRRATLIEIDPLVAAFWKSVVSDPEQLCRMISDTRLNLSTWQKHRKLLSAGTAGRTQVELGFAAILLNRTCYSGILHAGPIGGYEQQSKYTIDCRFYRATLISRIQKIAALGGKLKVIEGDALKILRTHVNKPKPNSFFYVDPPYFKMGKRLYRHHYALNDHKNLADQLSQLKTPWLLSYDNHKAIRSLYKGFSLKTFDLRYHVSSTKRGRELLLSNAYLPPIRF